MVHKKQLRLIKHVDSKIMTDDVDSKIMINQSLVKAICFGLYRAGEAGPTSPTLVRPKILLFTPCIFRVLVGPIIVRLRVLFKWLHQSCTPSTAPVISLWPGSECVVLGT